MPVDMTRYPENWSELSAFIRFERAGGRCECTGECGLHQGRCEAVHGQPHPVTNSKVILTTMHLGVDHPDGTPGDKHDKKDVRPENLKAGCQRCHLVYDMEEHRENAMLTRSIKTLQAAREAGQLEMFA